MVETRCKKYRRLFFRGDFKEGKIEIKCPKCGYVQKIFKSSHKTLDFLKNGHKLSQINKSDSIVE